MNSSELLANAPKREIHRKEKTLNGWRGFSQVGATVTCTASNGGLAVTFLSPTMVRVRLWLGTFDENKVTGIVNLQQALPPALTVRESAGELEIAGEKLSVAVNKEDFTIRALHEGREIAADARPASWNRQTFTLSQILMKDDSVYGLGEKTGFLDKRAKRYEMWNSDVFSAHTATTDPLYVSVPFFIRLGGATPTGTAACGFYLDNSYRAAFDMGESRPDRYTVSAPGGNLDYYLMAAPDPAGVVRQFAELTGKAALPPRWALAHHQSRYSYKTAEEVLEVAEGFASRNLDCASIHLDIHYMDGNRTFTWDEDAFPEPAALADTLAAQNIRLTAIVDPAIKADPEYSIYREMAQNGYCCRYADGRPYVGKVWPGDSVFPDFVRSDVREWWGEKVLSFMDEHGIEGIWHDMNEPAVFNNESTMDLNVCHGETGMDSHARFHNLYAYYECMATHEAIRNKRKTRPFILSRAGFAGIQKYAAVWTGDNRSMWEHLELSLPMLLNMGLSGIPFVGADIGGFSFNASPELLVRWYQLGMFYPFARNHCAEHARRQEPWAFDSETERLVTKSMRLRERLLPEFYTAFYRARAEGQPVMRPLVWDYPEEPEARHIFDQILFAQGMLAAPVLRPGVHIRSLYLPEGIWFNYYTGERHSGGRWLLAEAPLERMPLFVKAGSMIVTDEGEAGQWTVTLWNDESVGEGRWQVYSDDGISLDYEEGGCSLDTIGWRREGTALRISVECEGNPACRSWEKLRFMVKNAGNLAIVIIEGKPVDVSRDGDTLGFVAGFPR